MTAGEKISTSIGINEYITDKQKDANSINAAGSGAGCSIVNNNNLGN